MMTKKILLGLGLCSLLAFPVANAQAENGFCSGGQVLSAGTNLGTISVQILNTRSDCGTWGQGTGRTFFINDTNGQANAMLATALAAQASQATVIVATANPNFTDGSFLTLLFSQSL